MIRALLSILPAGSGPRVAIHLVMTVLSVVVRAVGVVLLVPLVSALFGEDPAAAWPWVGALALATLVGWGIDWATARIGFALGFGLLETGQRTVADRIARVRLTWFSDERTAMARQAIASTGPALVGIIVYLVTPVLSAVLLPIAIALALIPIAWPLALAALAGVPILLGAFWLSARLSRSADRAAERANAGLTERIIEFARTQQALRAARRVEPERSQAGAAIAAQHGAVMRLLLMQIPGQIIFSLASQIALLLLAGTTVLLAVRGEVSVPQAIALIVVTARYLEPFTTLGELTGGVENSTGTLQRIRQVLDAPAVTAGRAAAAPGGGDAPRIELRDVSFAYAEGAEPVLEHLDLVFEPGTTTAVVGPSGSGKSTILALLAGLQEPSSGAVSFDGIDAASLEPEARRALVSVVFQHPYLFDASLRENVLVGDPAAPADALDRASRLARVDGILARLDGGWDSRAGEGGGALSGGERQRVSIARALLKPAPVLLVDEATSALDTENEAAITAALGEDPVPRTRLIVAHRLASIRGADRVVFVEGGRVVEQGTIEDLLAAGGRFAEFWRQQDEAAGWRLGASR